MVAHTCNAALRKPRQESLKFRVILDYITSPCLKHEMKVWENVSG